MAHVDKFKRADTGGLIAHYIRKQDKNGNYIKLQNQEIDQSRSHLNYNLCNEHDLSPYAFISKRMKEINHNHRRTQNVMCDWIVTLPDQVKAEDQDRFFQESYEYLKNKYGKENVICSYVHLDETTPHMHFAFMPVLQKENKLDCKSIINRNSLKVFHKDFKSHIDNILGYDSGVLNGATEPGKGNRTVEELKKDNTYLANRNRMLQKEKEDLIVERNKLEEEVWSLKKDKEFLMTTNAALRNAAEELEKHIEIVEEKVEETKEIIKEIDNFENSKAANWIADFITKVRRFISEAREEGKEPKHIAIPVKSLETLERALQPFLRLKEKVVEIVNEMNTLQNLISSARKLRDNSSKPKDLTKRNHKEHER